MGFEEEIKVNEEWLRDNYGYHFSMANDSFKNEVTRFIETVTDWSFANCNCLLKNDVEMNVTKDVNSLYK